MRESSAERYWTWRHQETLKLEALEAEVARLRDEYEAMFNLAGKLAAERKDAQESVARLRTAITALLEVWDLSYAGDPALADRMETAIEDARAALAGGDATPRSAAHSDA